MRVGQLGEIVLKRLIDVAISATALLILGAVMASLSLLVAVRLGRPILFAQDRPGLEGRIFRLYKFRTMSNARDANGVLLSDSDRLTAFGRFLRATSLDELPELWNVLKGDMSLVGPRPLAVQYLGRYTDIQMRRHEVRPGITGLAQVSGRNDLPWEQRLELDVWYVDNQSLWLDLRILAETIVKVFRREGASRPGQADMPDFRAAQLLGEAAGLDTHVQSPARPRQGSAQ